MPHHTAPLLEVDSGGRKLGLSFMTASWRGDLENFRWLRRSLAHAGLSAVPHRLVVHTEDLPLFRPLVEPGMQLLGTAEVLPAALEQRRLESLQRFTQAGPRLGKLCLSLNKRLGWFDWVRAGGWQMQQITKLAMAADDPADAVVVLDSDLLVTRAFDLRLFLPEGRVALFEQALPHPGRWHASAYQLLQQDFATGAPFNGYVGTPFVFSPLSVRGLLQWLQTVHGRPWYETLLAQRVSSWSEFCIYSLFVRTLGKAPHLLPRAQPHSRDLYFEDLAGPVDTVETAIRQRFADPQIYFTNIPSQRLAMGRWSLQQLGGLLQSLMSEVPACETPT